MADALSRWAYPASKALADVSKHGCEADDAAMRDIIAQELLEERECRVIHVEEAMEILRVQVEEGDIAVTTRSGRQTEQTRTEDTRTGNQPDPEAKSPASPGSEGRTRPTAQPNQVRHQNRKVTSPQEFEPMEDRTLRRASSKDHTPEFTREEGDMRRQGESGQPERVDEAGNRLYPLMPETHSQCPNQHP